jgi:3-methyladenine DNA glycosylase AlkD
MASQTKQKAAGRRDRAVTRPGRSRPSVRRKVAQATDESPISASAVLGALGALRDAAAAQFAERFFKTGPGEYGEGDQFLGIRVPALRAMVRDLADTGLEVALPLLRSGWHEARALALMLLVKAYQRADEPMRRRIYRTYLDSTQFINGWDLVDLSAEHIVGAWLADKPAERKRVLNRLAKSKSLWERRIAILATFHYIKRGDYAETLRVAELLLKDDEDLIQKAVGWMLREVGKRVGEPQEEGFLKRHYRAMPRTMLRYAIERFAEPKRKRYLMGLV